MNRAWQLAVIDTDRIESLNKSLNGKPLSTFMIDPLPNGSIVFVVSDLDSNDTMFKISDLSYRIALVYSPERACYWKVLLSSIWPMLTEKDIIEAELKFGISLKDYV